MAAQRAQQHTVGDAPLAHDVVVAPADQRGAVGAERDGGDALRMHERAEQHTVVHTPELDRPIHAAGGEQPAVGTERDVAPRCGMMKGVRERGVNRLGTRRHRRESDE